MTVRVVDLFSGAGGTSCGLRQAGMMPVAAVIDKSVFAIHGSLPLTFSSVVQLKRLRRPYLIGWIAFSSIVFFRLSKTVFGKSEEVRAP